MELGISYETWLKRLYSIPHPSHPPRNGGCTQYRPSPALVETILRNSIHNRPGTCDVYAHTGARRVLGAEARHPGGGFHRGIHPTNFMLGGD